MEGYKMELKKKWNWRMLMGFIWLGTGSRVHILFGSIKGGTFVHQLKDYPRLNKD
jgi:hypothetical protein